MKGQEGGWLGCDEVDDVADNISYFIAEGVGGIDGQVVGVGVVMGVVLEGVFLNQNLSMERIQH